MNLNQIVKLTRENCIDGYFAASHYHIEPFGLNCKESEKVFDALIPDNHFKFSSFFTPESMNIYLIVKRISLIKYKEGIINLFHFKPKKRILKNKLDDKTLFNKIKGFSCIYPDFTGSVTYKSRRDISLPTIAGPKRVMSDITKFLTNNPNDFFSFYRMITPKKLVSDINDKTLDIDFLSNHAKVLQIHDYIKGQEISIPLSVYD